MEEEKRYSYKWMYAAMVIAFVVAAVVMVRFGFMAREMPDAAKELNMLMSEKAIACSKNSRSAECSKAGLKLKNFQKKWFAKSNFSAAHGQPR